MADDFSPEPYISFQGDQAVTNYHQCMTCDKMMSGPEKGQVPTEVEHSGPPLPEGISPFQANAVSYAPEGAHYQSNRTPEGRKQANISHALCKDCYESQMADVRRRHRELAEQREREERERKAEARQQRRFRRGRKDQRA